MGSFFGERFCLVSSFVSWAAFCLVSSFILWAVLFSEQFCFVGGFVEFAVLLSSVALLIVVVAFAAGARAFRRIHTT